VSEPSVRTDRALFLDRDGTLIVDKVYLADPAGVELIPALAARSGARANWVTNSFFSRINRASAAAITRLTTPTG